MKAFVFALLVAVAAAAEIYPKPAYPAPAYSKPEPPMPYDFAWAVNDEPTYNDYAHKETGDDKGLVTGSYRVALPDGRTQIVNFKADSTNGYTADVKYEGEAQYPESKSSYPARY